MKSGSINLLEPSGPILAHTGIVLPLPSQPLFPTSGRRSETSDSRPHYKTLQSFSHLQLRFRSVGYHSCWFQKMVL